MGSYGIPCYEINHFPDALSMVSSPSPSLSSPSPSPSLFDWDVAMASSRIRATYVLGASVVFVNYHQHVRHALSRWFRRHISHVHTIISLLSIYLTISRNRVAIMSKTTHARTHTHTLSPPPPLVATGLYDVVHVRMPLMSLSHWCCNVPNVTSLSVIAVMSSSTRY